MQHRGFRRIALAVALLAGMSVVQLGGTGVAGAAVVPLGCEVTNGGVPVDLTVAVDTEDPFLASYPTGSFLAVHDAVGNFSSVPAAPGELGVPPVCAVEVLRDADGDVGFGPAGWLWCTDLTVDTCIDVPGTDQGSDLGLGPDDPAVLPDPATWFDVTQKTNALAWAVDSTEDTTEQSELLTWQNRIWCITDGTSGIDAGVDPGPYVPGDAATATCAGFRTWLLTNLLPFFAPEGAQISLALSGTGASAPVNEPLRIRVTSTLPTVYMGATAIDTVWGDVCPGDTTGASFADSTLTMTPGTTVEMCVTAERATTVAVIGESGLGRISFEQGGVRFGGPGCSVMVTSEVLSENVASNALDLTWTEAVPTTTAPPAAPEPTPRRLAFAG